MPQLLLQLWLDFGLLLYYIYCNTYYYKVDSMSNKASNYPEWVLKFKEKGTFVNKTVSKDGTVSYYLYRGHSERDKETGKVKRIVDGCIGRITEADGLIPARHRLTENPHILEFGRSRICVHFTEYMLPGLGKNYGDDAQKVYTAAVLTWIYGYWTFDLYKSSWLSLRFPDVLSQQDESSMDQAALQRVLSMITYIAETRIGTDLPMIMACCSLICLIVTKSSMTCSYIPPAVSDFSRRQGIEWKEELWKQ